MNWKASALGRIARTPSLKLAEELILGNLRGYGDAEWEWLATAPEQEIVDWIEEVVSGQNH